MLDQSTGAPAVGYPPHHSESLMELRQVIHVRGRENVGMVNVRQAAIKGLDVCDASGSGYPNRVRGIERIHIGFARVEILGVRDPGCLRQVVVGLRPSVVGKDRQAVRHPLFQRGLQRVEVRTAAHAGFDDLRIACSAASGGCAWSYGGCGVIDATLIRAQSGAGIYRGVQFEVDKLMAGGRADVGEPHDQTAGQLLLDDEVVVVGDRYLEVAGWIVLPELECVREDLVRRERQREGEWIGIRSHTAASAVGIAEWAAGVNSWSGAAHPGVSERYGDGIRNKAGLAEVEEAGEAVLVKDAGSATHHCFAVAKDVERKAETRHELGVFVVDAVRRHAGIAR